MDYFFPKFFLNEENDNENLSNFSGFDNILIYILIFIRKIVLLLKIDIFRREKNFNYFSIPDEKQSKFLFSENEHLEVKYESKKKLIIRVIKDDHNDKNDNLIKKRKQITNKNNFIIRHYIIIIRLIIINIFMIYSILKILK